MKMEGTTLSLFLLSAFLTLCYSQDFPTFLEENDPSNSDIMLKRMILDPDSGRLYVGSVNMLYKLSGDLVIEQEEVTGPKNHSPECIPPDYVNEGCQLSTTNNVNKILVIDTNTQLITCGNVYRGTCETRNMVSLVVIEPYYRQVAAYSPPDASTVALIGRGPNALDTGLGDYVLYVGTSKKPEQEDKWYPLSSRILPSQSTGNDEPFSILSDTEKSGSILASPDFTLENLNFDIDYISVFTSEGFIYYVAIQPKMDTETSGPFVTKIIQICQSCGKYKETYIDLPLVCKSIAGVDYNLAQSAYVAVAGANLAENMNLNVDDDNQDILVVSFAEAEGTTKTPTQNSAVCIYSIKSIRQKYLDWVQQCSDDGNLPTGCLWSKATTLCGNQMFANLIINGDMCDCRISKMTCGSLDIIERPSFTSSGSIITAVATVSHDVHTIIFAGSQDGHLKKLKVTNVNSALEYEDIKVVANNPEIVQNGLLFDASQDYIYVMSTRQITKVPVENCEKYTTCGACLGVEGVGDPYCGWCTLENRCTRQATCEGHTDTSTSRWIDGDFECPSIDVVPSSVERSKLEVLTLTVTSLPQSTQGFRCVFDSLGTTAADPATPNILTCTTPPPTNIPPPGNRGYVRVKLSLKSDETGKIFVSTDFDFYDCASFKTCMACTDNTYGCDWCIFENKCSKDVSACRPEGIIQGNANVPDSSSNCPQIEAGAEILIPVDLSQDFDIIGKNFPQPLVVLFPVYVAVCETAITPAWFTDQRVLHTTYNGKL